jgi:hypothetical protein
MPMKKQAIIKKFHKPVRPVLSIAMISGAVAIFIIILSMSTLRSQQLSNQKPTDSIVLSHTPTQESSQPTIYHSKFMQITFNIPSGFQLTDLTSDIILKNDGGEINIDSIGTNYKTLDGYLLDLSQKNKFIVAQRQELVINQLPAISCYFSTTPEVKAYLISPVVFSVVTVSTKSPVLFKTLDQIAQSIKFMP